MGKGSVVNVTYQVSASIGAGRSHVYGEQSDETRSCREKNSIP